MKEATVFIEFCNDRAIPPLYSRKGDAGMDIFCPDNCVLEPGETKVINVGFKVAVPSGYELQVRPRSSLSFKTPLRIANSPGTIDSGYRDEVGIIVQNTGKEPYYIQKGDRIAQLILKEFTVVKWKKVSNVSAIGYNRGGGFGHTGK